MADAEIITNEKGPAIIGRIEYNHSGYFGSTCDDNAAWATARVFCRQVQLPYLNAGLIKEFGGGHGEILFGNVRCKGDELDIKSCPRYELIGIGLICNHKEDLGVSCQ